MQFFLREGSENEDTGEEVLLVEQKEEGLYLRDKSDSGQVLVSQTDSLEEGKLELL